MVVYNELYNIIVQFVYGNPESLDSFQTLVATEVATCGSIALVALPIICSFWLVKFIFNLGRLW